MRYDTYRRSLTPIVRTLYRLQVRGEENVPLEGPLVVACNHESVLDPFVLGAAIPREIRFVTKAELWRIPVLRSWLDSVGGIPIERGRSDTSAMAAGVAALGGGEVVGIFPEGGVRRSGPWLRGAARMALTAGAPLLPVRLLDTRRAVGRGSIEFPPLAVLIGEPIVVERARPTVTQARDLTKRLQAAVEALGT